MELPDVLPIPLLPYCLPQSAKWLSGEGAGSWFVIDKQKEQGFNISRYSPKGLLECTGLFVPDKAFNYTIYFEIDYPAHCMQVAVKQKGIYIVFNK